MKALLLAGGRGTRLLPHTAVIPKPLMPVGNRAIIEILLLQLQGAGIKDVVIAVGYLSHLFKAYLGNGERLGMTLTYVEERQPLGTAGPIGMALDQLDEEFLLMNGDLLTTLDFRRLLDFHVSEKASATIGTYPREVRIDFGVLDIDEHKRLISYREKPKLNYLVSMGVYVLNKASVAPIVQPVRRLDAPDLMIALMQSGAHVACYKDDCYWLDIGRPDDYQLANEIVSQGKLLLPPDLP